jgi:TorA maturation chaperone TorD
MNDFSLMCRVLGSLFYRQPQDPLLVPLFTLIEQGKLEQHWPLEQSELLARLQQGYQPTVLVRDYNVLFVGPERRVSPYASDYDDARPEAEVRAFLQQYSMPLGTGPTDHVGGLLLAASWLEDQAANDKIVAQTALFNDYLLPCCGRFLGKVEAHATTGFYRTLAQLSREALQAMWDDLSEEDDDTEEE